MLGRRPRWKILAMVLDALLECDRRLIIGTEVRGAERGGG